MRPARSLVSGLFAALLAALVACADDDVAEPSGEVAAATTPGNPATPATPATPASDAAAAVADSVVLGDIVVLARDGLGVADFGERADVAIGAITAVLGEPTADTGWVDPLTLGTCAGDQARAVSWGSLQLFFSDRSDAAADEPQLVAFSYGTVSDLAAFPEGLATPEGIGLGTTVSFLRAAYPEVVAEPGEDGLVEPSFYVDDDLSGRITGTDDDDLVTVIIGGDACGAGT